MNLALQDERYFNLNPNYIVIENDGELDLNAMRLIGASTKRDDSNTIGQFGSGFKYALAWMLRNNIDFKVYSGTKLIEVTKVSTPLRDMFFDVIYIDGVPTSLTTDMGPDWEGYHAFRELYCNALDEKAEDPVRLVNAYSGTQGKTSIVIKNEGELAEIVSNFQRYFCKDVKEVFASEGSRILPKIQEGVLRIYRRGILILEVEDSKCQFDYDLRDVAINEMRTPKYGWEWKQIVGKLLYSCTDIDVIRKSFRSSESDLWILDEMYVSTFAGSLTSEWVHAIGERKIATPSQIVYMKDKSEYQSGGIVVVPDKVYGDLEAAFSAIKTLFSKAEMTYTTLDKTPLHSKMLEGVIKKLSAFNIDIEFSIEVVDFVDAKTMGMVLTDTKTILVSKKAFLQGEQYLMETVLEEYVHIEYDVEDETRAMQDVLLRLLAQKVMES